MRETYHNKQYKILIEKQKQLLIDSPDIKPKEFQEQWDKKKGIRRRMTAVFEKNISQQTTQNIDWKTTKNLHWFLSQQTEDVSRKMVSKK